MYQVENLFFLIILTSKSTLGFPSNPIVEGLRAIFSGESDFKFDVFNDISLPANMIPEEFKFIKKGLCGSARTRKCFCEENADIDFIVFPPGKDSVRFKDIKKIFAHCRPT